MSQAAERRAVIAEALTWKGTPWHHRARIKGAGVDCIQFLIGVYHACGLCPAIDTGYYPPDWMRHRDEERLLNGVRQYADEIEAPGLGDIVVYRFGRCFSHAGIFTGPQEIVHAYLAERVVTLGDPDGGRLAGRERKFFSVWGDR
jgi:NlpC/P60 family putative phage cell wall peptidase